MADEETSGAAEEAGGEDATPPSEEELRAQLEEEIRKVRVEDVVLQSAVSILNLSARRIAKDDERDLEQGLGIDAAKALIELVPGDAQGQLQQAISELQLLYAKHAGEDDGEKPPEDEEKPPEGGDKPDGGGDSPLWTPGG
jgi:hypothetical protein